MNKAVIGLGYGDEGKGLVVDWLCSKSPDLVVRFNGGHQAGHTVCDEDYRHIFSNFGSGTLKGNPTYWSKFCTVEPRGLMKELKLLQSNGYDPVIFIDEDCPITTPYDMWFNQSNRRHGTVGVGFGATIAREERFYSLTFVDLSYEDVFIAKYHAIREQYGIINVNKEIEKEWLKACCDISRERSVFKRVGLPNRTCIFEGAQGLLLDQHYGFFPHVTRSNTGTKNILQLSTNPIHYYLVTRAYQTRHGEGFMTNREKEHSIQINPKETNVENLYQGEFRRSLLDVSLLEYGIQKDPHLRSLTSASMSLVITCLNHIETDYRFTYDKKIYEYDSEFDFIEAISSLLEIDEVYVSHGDHADGIQKWSPTRKVSSVGRATDR